LFNQDNYAFLLRTTTCGCGQKSGRGLDRPPWRAADVKRTGVENLGGVQLSQLPQVCSHPELDQDKDYCILQNVSQDKALTLIVFSVTHFEVVVKEVFLQFLKKLNVC